MKKLMRHAVLTMTGAILFLGATPVLAQETAEKDLLAQIADLEARDSDSRARIRSLEERLEALESLLGMEGATSVPDAAQADMRGAGVLPAYAYANSANVPANGETEESAISNVGAESRDRKSPAPTDAVQDVAAREQGYFGDRFSIEFGLNYAHFDDARLNLSGFLALDSIFLGTISVDETSADVLTTDLTARWSITNRLQLDANVPYLYRHANFQSGGAGSNASGLIDAQLSDSGLGDVSVGASYRVLTETFTRPDLVFHMRAKAPTGRDPFGIELVEVEGSAGNLTIPEKMSFGTGVWSTSAGVSVLKTLDPMVVFGSLTYFHNWKGSFGDIDEAPGDQPGSVRLGDALQYGVGVAFALNERSSLSTSFTQRFVQRSELLPSGATDWRKVVGSQANVALLNFGATFALSDKISLLANVSTGMTEDAPDLVAGLRLPIRF